MSAHEHDIRFECPSCHNRMRVDGRHAGRRVRCRQCETIVSIPAGSREPTVSAPSVAATVAVATPDSATETSRPVSQNETANPTPHPLTDLNEIFWGRIALCTGIYWMIRWLSPSWLPEELRSLEFHHTVIVGAVPAFFWTAATVLARLVSAAPTSRPAQSNLRSPA